MQIENDMIATVFACSRVHQYVYRKKKKKANSEMDFEHVQYLFINPLYPQDY